MEKSNSCKIKNNYDITNIMIPYICVLVMENLVQAFLQTSRSCRLNQRDMRNTAYSCSSTLSFTRIFAAKYKQKPLKSSKKKKKERRKNNIYIEASHHDQALIYKNENFHRPHHQYQKANA
jgi:hypothetical protein